MSAAYDMDYTRALQRKVVWDETRTKAASLLAMGYKKQHVADEVGVTRMTIYNWLDDPEFAEEVDRLSIMVGIASRAQRLRWANRTIVSRLNEDGSLQSDKDVLDWLKFAQSETDGAKIDLSKLAEMLGGEQAQGVVAPGSGPPSRLLDQSGTIEVSATQIDISHSQQADGPEGDEALNPS